MKTKKLILLYTMMLFCASLIHAQKVNVGKYIFPKDGSTYYGELVGGKPNGKGKTTFKTGDTYEGEYVNGLRQGYGVYTFTDGEKYEGNWYQDHQHGKGVFYFVNSEWKKYDGMWYLDFMQGEGTMYYSNGDIYIGEWLQDKRNGHGKYIYYNGDVFEGSWEKDKRVGHGVLSPTNGETIKDVRENGVAQTSLNQKSNYYTKRRFSTESPTGDQHSPKVIQMEKDGGVYKIQCIVNGAKMKMVFDTGAAAVSLSMFMANYLYENDYIKKDDIIGTGMSQTADGSIVDHVVINLRDIEISGLHINNVRATVIDGQNAPLLLGQTAIQALGPVTIDGNRLIINNHKDQVYSEQEIDRLENDADAYYTNKQYFASLDAYSKLNLNIGLNTKGYFRLINSCIQVEQYNKALDYFTQWENSEEFGEADESEKAVIYSMAANVCGRQGDPLKQISLMEKQFACQQKAGENIAGLEFDILADAYYDSHNLNSSIKYRKKAINSYLSYDGHTIADIYNGTISDNYIKNNVGWSLYAYAITLAEKNKHIQTPQENYLWVGAAKCGIEEAINSCNIRGINYKKVQHYSKYDSLFSIYGF